MKWFPAKIQYERLDDKGITPCPHGGAISSGYGVFNKGIEWPGAKVGSRACDGCFFNKGTEISFVRCAR